MNDLMKYFDESISKEMKMIKYGSLIALKHSATGKYLSSCDINYQTGVKNQLIYAGNANIDSNALWIISHPIKQKDEPLVYGGLFYLEHYKLNKHIFPDSDHNGPSGKYAQVYCSGKINTYALFYCISAAKTKDDNSLYVNTNDKINLKSRKQKYILRSHESTFDIDYEQFQEVVGHQDRINGYDEV
ncbi:hypothetical protein C1645_792375 [Glomus cerebriforme]|uniref:MIR domain-containing protein n=1 Tax=Glomus cerebriforme TaxID=658196 RepID=A0A397S743_9GLOM|nr:hypothetical protein C1645_792375 [Glomus cerebriforme]